MRTTYDRGMATNNARTLRFEVRVKPGASGTGVGGTYGESDALNVWVPERAEDGKANDAVRQILATVLNVKKHQVAIVHGETHRTKVIEVSNPRPDTAHRLNVWRTRTAGSK